MTLLNLILSVTIALTSPGTPSKSQVAYARMYSLNPGLESSVAISPQAFMHFQGLKVRLLKDPHALADLQAAIDQVKIENTQKYADIRYGIVLYDAHWQVVQRLFMDRFFGTGAAGEDEHRAEFDHTEALGKFLVRYWGYR